jgi:hypothetical protein
MESGVAKARPAREARTLSRRRPLDGGTDHLESDTWPEIRVEVVKAAPAQKVKRESASEIEVEDQDDI